MSSMWAVFWYSNIGEDEQPVLARLRERLSLKTVAAEVIVELGD